MMMSDKGYIDSFDDIEKLTERVMSIDARKLTVREGYNPNTIVEDLLIFNALPEDCSYTVRICDMLNMARQLVHCQYPGDRICTARYAVITADMLDKASFVSSDIKLFLSISVKAFADFMDKRSGKIHHECKMAYKAIIAMAKESALLEVTEKTTIKAVIEGIRPYMTRWGPRMHLNAFVNHTENCCEIIRKIFVDFIYAGYADMFDFSKLKKAVNEQRRKDILEIEESIEAEFLDPDFDEEELPFDMDYEADEFEQLSIEFQALSEDTGRGSDKESNDESDSSADITSGADKKIK